jgi:hypothetical protein
MIRKITLFMLTLTIVCAPALAAGDLTVNMDNMLAYDSYGYATVEVYAEIENTGDRDIEFSSGVVELFDADGNTVASTDYLYSYPPVLAPGDKGYASAVLYMEEGIAAADIADYSITVLGKNATTQVIRYESEGTYLADVEEQYWTYDYVVAEIKNETDDPAYNFYCAYVIKDEAGDVLHFTYTSAYDVGIPAGGSILMRLTVPDYVIERFAEQGVSPATVETFAYQINY